MEIGNFEDLVQFKKKLVDAHETVAHQPGVPLWVGQLSGGVL